MKESMWTDVTKYDKQYNPKGEIRCLECSLPEDFAKIKFREITFMVHLLGGGWHLSSDSLHFYRKDLSTEDLELAKERAVEFVSQRLQAIKVDIDAALATLKGGD